MEEELKNINKLIAELSLAFPIVRSEEIENELRKLWQRKRVILAEVNLHNKQTDDKRFYT